MKALTNFCTLVFCLTATLSWGQNDLAILEARYGNYDPETDESWTNLEYSVYPLSQVRPLFLNARITNFGNTDQTGVQLEVEITNNLGYSETVISDPITVTPGDTLMIELDPYTPPQQIGNYSLDFVVFQNESDDNPLDNTANRTFRISEAEFARDMGELQGIISDTASIINYEIGLGEYSGGPAYSFTGEATIYCIGAAISSTSDIGSPFYYYLRDGVDFDPVMDSQVGVTSPQFFFETNAGVYHWLPLNASVDVEAEASNIPMFHTFGASDQVFLGTSGESQPLTNYSYAELSFQTCDPCYNEVMYMVRMGLSQEFCLNAINPGLDFLSVNGLTYHDENCDGEYNNGENVFSGQTVYKDDGTPVGYSNQMGEYTAYVVTNQQHNLHASELIGFSTNTVEVFEEEPVDVIGANFGYCLESELIDFGVTISPVGLPPRPGFPVEYEVCLTNHGSSTTGAEVTFDYSNMLNVSVIDADGGTDSGSSISWSIEEVGLFETQCFSITMQVAVGTPAGTILNPVVVVYPAPPGVDINVHNDEHSFIHEVVAAYDPNDKTVDYPVVNYTELEPGEGAELEYLIRFQNTGNFFATTVRVEDELPELLDISTIEMIHASHDFELLFHDEHNIEWVFEDIMLPDSTSDEPGSHGHIHFRIKTVPEVSLEDVIENSASIFFDFKDPVITEPAMTSFIDCSAGSLSIEAPAVICQEELSTFSSNRPEFDEYVWSINDQEIIGQEIEYTSFTEEVLNVELTVSNAVCTLSTEMQLPVVPQPSFAVIPEGFTLCDLEQELDINAVGSVSWFLDDELVATGDPVVLSESGNYYVVAENECGSFEINVPVQIVDTPDEVSITNDGQQLTVEPEGSDYVWLLNGLPISTEGPTLVPTESGDYSVVVYFEGSSCSLSSNVLLVTVSVDEMLAARTALFPNPAENVVTVVLPQGLWKVSLIDATGRDLQSIDNVVSSQIDLDLKGIMPGAYLVRIDSEQGSVVKKLVVK